MKAASQKKLVEALDKDCLEILEKKTADYASDVDVLSNFKNIAKAAKALQIDITTPSGVALFMALLKVARIANLQNGGTEPSNESVRDSYTDLLNYSKFGYLCLFDSSVDG